MAGAAEIPSDTVFLSVSGIPDSPSTVVGATAEVGLSLVWALAPAPLHSAEVMDIAPPGRASVPSLVAAVPVPPPLEKPVVSPVALFPVAVAAPPDDEVIVGDLANEKVAREMASFIEDL